MILLVLILMPWEENVVLATPDLVQEKADFLIDEWFVGQQKGFTLSGWEIDNTGAEVSWQPFTLKDVSTAHAVRMARRFPEQYHGRLMLDTCIKMQQPIDGTTFRLSMCNDTAVEILFENGKWYYVLQDDKRFLTDASADGNTLGEVFRITADLDRQSVDIVINDCMAGSGLPFQKNVSCLDRFSLDTGREGTGAMTITGIQIYKGYLAYDRFLTPLWLEMPYGWERESAGGRVGTYGGLPREGHSDEGMALQLRDTESAARCTATRRFDRYDGALDMEFLIMAENLADGAGVEFLWGNTRAGRLYLQGEMLYWTGAGQNIPLGKVRSRLWYTVQLSVDNLARTAALRLNYKDVRANLPLEQQVDALRFVTSFAGNGNLWLDDLKVFPHSLVPDDYVPVPKLLPDDGILTGIQSCSLWTEGRGRGWGEINRYPERKPVLGYYDEGKPEVSDWEIKYQLEHGIDFQVYCWFRWMQDAPVKTPMYGAGLHEGFLNSRYSDKMKFMIMFENVTTGVVSGEDFRNNVVPYWIEYYFKDDRYLKIDGKPVVSFFLFDRFVSQVGGQQQAKENLTYLKEECVRAGFPGAEVLVTYSGFDQKTLPETFAAMRDAGVDGIYCYNWNNSSDSVWCQQTYLGYQAAAAPDMLVPTVVSGWDASPWGGKPGRVNNMLTPQEFGNMIRWVDTDLRPILQDGNPGKKMLFLANWNEFGEGTYIAPNAEYGFSHMDAVREALYSEGEGHTDVLPTRKQLERITGRYPQNLQFPAEGEPYHEEGTPGELDGTNFNSIGRVNYQVNGKSEQGRFDALIAGEVLMAEFGEFCKVMGAQGYFNPKTGEISLRYKNCSLRLSANTTRGWRAEEKVRLSAAPICMNHSVMVPVSDVTELLGGSAGFDRKTGVLTIRLP